MANAKAIIRLGRTETGLVIGNLTWDFCKEVSDGDAVSTASSTLTELGVGLYVLTNPNITEDTAFSIYKTADSSVYAEGIFSLLDGNLALEASVQAIDDYVDTEVGAIKAVTDKVDGLIENSSGNRFTAKALEASPVGEGGGASVQDMIDGGISVFDPSTDPVVLASSQPLYAPAKAGDVMGKSPATLAAADVSGNLPADVKAITTGVDFSTVMKASINTEADTALADYDPPTRAEATSDKDAVISAVGVVGGYIDTEITSIINALSALQGDLGDPSSNGTTAYAQLSLIKGYVDDLETRLTATRAGYLDNLSGGAVALNSTVAKEVTLANATYGLSALKDLIDLIDTSTELQARFTEIKGAGWATETLKAIKDSIGEGGVSIDPQDVRDAMALALSEGVTPAEDSIDDKCNGISVDLTPVTNALMALQDDLGNPSVDVTTIYAQILLIKGYVDELESRLTATRAGYLDNLADGAVALNSTVAKANDARLDNLDAKISTRSTLTAQDVWEYAERTLSSFGDLVSNIWGFVTRKLTSAFSDETTPRDMAVTASIVVPIMQTPVHTAMINHRTVRIFRDNTLRLPFNVLGDFSGFTGRFAAKRSYDDTEYVFGPKTITWIDAGKGLGYVDLTAADTAAIGEYVAELELRSGDQCITVELYNLTVLDKVIR